MIQSEVYVDFLSAQYLGTFIKDGGATVKFCVAGDNEIDDFASRITASSERQNLFVVRIDASTTKVHMIEQIFFEVAKHVDWELLATNAAATACEQAGYPFPAGTAHVTLEALADYYQGDVRELQRDVNRQLQRFIFHDYEMVQEFRIAMLRLCQYELATGQVSEAEYESLRQWLRGELRQISLLKSARIFRKINRNNARHMLFSLVHWMVKNEYKGMVLIFDFRQLFGIHNSDTATVPTVTYSKAAVLDAYESIRQLIDNSDEFSNFASFVCVPPEFLSDRSRGIGVYQALKLRIYDEVHDQYRDNPYSALVRLGRQVASQSAGQDALASFEGGTVAR